MKLHRAAESAFSAAAGILLAGAIRNGAAGVIVPLAAAWLGAEFVRPSALRLSRRLRRIPEKTVCAAYAVFWCGALLYLLAAASGKLAGELWSLAASIPEAAEQISERLAAWFDRLPPVLRREGGAALLPLLREGELASGLASSAVSSLASALQKASGGLISAFAAAAGFVYLTADPKGAGEAVLSLLPEEAAARASRIFAAASAALFSCARACAILMLLSFAELSVGLTLLGVPNPLAAALLAALADALPVLGCGIVLTPWAGWLFLTGEYGRAAGMLALTAAVWLTRQLAEPGLLGKAASLSPFASFLCLLIGWKLGGAGGMILAPVIAGAAAGMRRESEKQIFR